MAVMGGWGWARMGSRDGPLGFPLGRQGGRLPLPGHFPARGQTVQLRDGPGRSPSRDTVVFPGFPAGQPTERALQSPATMTFFKHFPPLLVVLAFVQGALVEAAPRRVVLASGDCQDAELSGQAQAFYRTLAARSGEHLLTPEAFAEQLFPQPAGSFEDLQRRLEAAQGQFYEARHAKSAQAVDEVLRQVSRLPVGEARWKLSVGAWLLRGMNLRALGQVKESDDAFRRVLRLDAAYALDPDYYPPSTRQSFEKLRREQTRAPRVRLSVKSTLPSSEVFLDGRAMGPTPLTLEVPAGTYELTVQKDKAVSIPRQLSVQGGELPVLVDLAYEGSIQATPFPCLATPEGAERGFSHAIRLGGTLGVEEVIVVRLERASSGPKWLAATVLNVEGGQKLREGGFKTQGLDAPAESLGALVDFITTGKTQPSLVVTQPDLQPPWEKSAPEVAAPPALAEVKTGGTRPLRVVSGVVMGAGVATLMGAGLVRLSAERDWTALRDGHLNANGRVEANDAEGRRLVESLARKGQVLTGLLVGSGVALVTGGVLFLASPPRAAPPVTVGVTAGPGEVGASLSGTF